MLDQFILTCLFMVLGIILGIVAIAIAMSPAGWILMV